MSQLSSILREMISQEGPISVERYMALALGHPTHGYYISREPFGATGDFITAPEISQMFGELIGLWAAEVWTLMGSPAQIALVELGPGRGTLMSDALRAARVAPAFREALQVHLVETSPALSERQRQTLADSGAPVFWHSTIADVPPGPAIFIANEFFDALPVRQYVRTQMGWCERMVGLDQAGHFIFGLSGEPEPYLTAEAPVGAILEISAEGQRTMTALAARIMTQGGALLAIDYGHTRTDLGESLQAVREHRYADPLESPGEADLTTHVDFAALGRAARSTGCAVHGPVNQGDFLNQLGLQQRAAALAHRAGPDHAAGIEAAVRRLAGPGPIAGPDASMGELFKAMAVSRPSLPPLPGFASEAQA
jgi:SAM-dependent MidA family methyltransferase